MERPRARLDEQRPPTTSAPLLTRPAARRVLVRVTDVPGLGWKRVDPLAAGAAWPSSPSPPPAAMANGLVTVEVDPDRGTFSIRRRGSQRNLGRLVDDGDAGDTYNYSPPDGDSTVDRPDSCRWR